MLILKRLRVIIFQADQEILKFTLKVVRILQKFNIVSIFAAFWFTAAMYYIHYSAAWCLSVG